jgi:hypothetical protein
MEFSNCARLSPEPKAKSGQRNGEPHGTRPKAIKDGNIKEQGLQSPTLSPSNKKAEEKSSSAVRKLGSTLPGKKEDLGSSGEEKGLERPRSACPETGRKSELLDLLGPDVSLLNSGIDLEPGSDGSNGPWLLDINGCLTEADPSNSIEALIKEISANRFSRGQVPCVDESATVVHNTTKGRQKRARMGTPPRGPSLKTQLLNEFQKCQGEKDALKEKLQEEKEEKIDEEKAQKAKEETRKAIGQMRPAFARNLGLMLVDYFWQKDLYTESLAISGLLSSYRERGYLFELSSQPDLVLGMANMEAPYHLMPSSQAGDFNTPFYDQSIPGFYMDALKLRLSRVHFFDPEHMVLCAHEDKPLVFMVPRYSNREVAPCFGGLWNTKPDQTQGNLFYDTVLRQIVKPSRTYSDANFQSTIQAVMHHDSRPTYVEHQAMLTSIGLLSLYDENSEVFRLRTIYGDRRHEYDAKFTQLCSGFSVGSKAFSYAMVKDMLWSGKDIGKEAIEKVMEQPAPKAYPPPPRNKDQEDFFDPDLFDEPPDTSIVQKFKGMFEPVSPPSHQELPPCYLMAPFNRCEKEEPAPQELPSDDSEDSLLPSWPFFKKDPVKEEPSLRSSIWNRLFNNEQEVKKEEESISWEPDFDNVGHLIRVGGVDMIAAEYFGGLIAEASVDAGIGTLMPYYQGLKATTNVQWKPLKEWVDRHYGIYLELCARNQADRFISVCQSSNLGRKDYIDKVEYIRSIDLVGSSVGFHPDKVQVTWQEWCEPDGTDYLTYGQSLSYDESRISIQVLDPVIYGRFSEVYYGLYMEKARCFGQDYLLIAIKKRLGRSVPEANWRTMNYFLNFVESEVVLPEIDHSYDRLVTDHETYLDLLSNMPRPIRMQHMDFLSHYMSPTGLDDVVPWDSVFTKMDEVLLNPKGRMIINPPKAHFHSLVTGVTMVKKALKHEMFNLVFDTIFRIYFSYGADMTAGDKGSWMDRALELCAHPKPTACVLVGGDDNLVVFGYNGKVFAWESDVTACDQSHNKGLIKVMLAALRKMNCDRDWLRTLEDSYTRPVQTQNYIIKFLESQLHTGHSQTSLANTFVVGLIPIWLMTLLPIKGWQGELQTLRSHIETKTVELGMLWKVEVHSNYKYATFHKGFWVKGVSGHVWLPLPSCLWKATKIRCDSPVPWEELMLRMAFNLYQRIINNNVSTVSMLSTKMFHYIVNNHLQKIAGRYGQVSNSLGDLNLIMDVYQADTKLGRRFKRYVDLNYLNKSGESIETSVHIARDENNWDRAEEVEFMLHRYGMDDQDLRDLLGEGQWDGSFGLLHSPFMIAAIQRDYGSTQDSYEEDLLYRLEGGHVEPAQVQ